MKQSSLNTRALLREFAARATGKNFPEISATAESLTESQLLKLDLLSAGDNVDLYRTPPQTVEDLRSNLYLWKGVAYFTCSLTSNCVQAISPFPHEMLEPYFEHPHILVIVPSDTGHDELAQLVMRWKLQTEICITEAGPAFAVFLPALED